MAHGQHRQASYVRIWLQNPLAVWADCDDDVSGIVVADGLIEELTHNGAAPRQPVDATFDASGLVVTPGLRFSGQSVAPAEPMPSMRAAPDG